MTQWTYPTSCDLAGDELKAAKEAFVADLHGTSMAEVFVVLSTGPVSTRTEVRLCLRNLRKASSMFHPNACAFLALALRAADKWCTSLTVRLCAAKGV